MIHKNHSSSIESIILERVCMGKPTSELERTKERVKLNSEKNRNFYCIIHTETHTTNIFINYVDLSWPIEILIGIFMHEYVQCIQHSSIKYIQKWRTFTWTFFLCICGSTHRTVWHCSALLLHQKYHSYFTLLCWITVMCDVLLFHFITLYLAFISLMRASLMVLKNPCTQHTTHVK